MKVRRLLLVTFVCSLLLFLPVFSPTQKVTLFPFQEVQVVLNVKSTHIKITTDITSSVDLKLFYLNPNGDSFVNIRNYTIFGDVDIELGKRGNYLMTFTSVILGEVNIDPQGIPLSTPLIVILLGFLNLAYPYILRYRHVVEY